MKWKVQVTSLTDPEVTKRLLEEASYDLVSGESPDEDAKWFLTNPRWESLATHDDVEADVQRIKDKESFGHTAGSSRQN